MALWRPADIILFSPRNGGGQKTKAVKTVQKHLGFDEQHAQWTHAALYVGDGKLLHVTWQLFGTQNHVARIPISSFVPDAWIRRRSASSLNSGQRDEIVERAFTMIGQDYSLLRGLTFFTGKAGRQSQGSTQSALKSATRRLVCSDVVALAYEYVLNRQVFGVIDHARVTPATLSASTFLREAEVVWCSLPE
jgi:hypothetical protein